MHTYYINLPNAVERRGHVEENFRRWAPAGCELVRVAAVDPFQVAEMKVQGNLRPTEIACALSHRNAVAASLSDPDHSLIIEDDALFGPSTFEQLRKLGIWKDDTIDLVFTSAMISDHLSLLQLFSWRRSLLDKGEIALLDLSKIAHCGADAYVVKANAKTKLLNLLDGLGRFDIPYDIQLRLWIQSGQLNAVLAFPNLTTLSPLADHSSNGNINAEWLAYNCYRRLLSIDAAHYPGDIMAPVDAIAADFLDEEADRIGRLARVFAARNFKHN